MMPPTKLHLTTYISNEPNFGRIHLVGQCTGTFKNVFILYFIQTFRCKTSLPRTHHPSCALWRHSRRPFTSSPASLTAFSSRPSVVPHPSRFTPPQSRQSAMLFLQSLQLGLSHPPHPQASVFSPTLVRGVGDGEYILACGRGSGGPQFQRQRENILGTLGT